MAYPRRCPLYRADYHGSIRSTTAFGPASEFRHATLSAEPGGTPDPRAPTLPGRRLTLRCARCGGAYAWDYFAGRPADGANVASSGG